MRNPDVALLSHRLFVASRRLPGLKLLHGFFRRVTTPFRARDKHPTHTRHDHPRQKRQYSAFVTKNLLPPVVLGLHFISTPRSSDRFRQLHPPSSISEKLGSALGIIRAFGQR